MASIATTYPAKTYWTSAPGSEVAAELEATKATDTASAAKRNSALPTGLYHRRTRRDQLGRNSASSALCSRPAAVKTQARPARFTCSGPIGYKRTPALPRAHARPKYATTVTRHATPRLDQNETPERNMTGRTRKRGSEARTSQKMLRESAAMGSELPISRYNQTNAKSDVRGSEARTAPHSELRLPISETATTTATVMRTFAAYCHIGPLALTFDMSGSQAGEACRRMSARWRG